MRKSDMAMLREIKAAEQAKKKIQETVTPSDGLIDFETWWKEVNTKLGLKGHLKEIVFADFKARGCKKMDTKENFDKAMRLFGYEV